MGFRVIRLTNFSKRVVILVLYAIIRSIMGLEGAKLPYVVSEDLAGLVGEWAILTDRRPPSAQYFNDISTELRSTLQGVTGVPVEIIDETELRAGLFRFVEDSLLPVISLDRAYILPGHANTLGHIEMTRAVGPGPGFEDIGMRPRPGFPSEETQIEQFRSVNVEPVVLVDDVIFTGEGTLGTARKLQAIGRPVSKVIAGIAVREGITLLENAGIEVEQVRCYEDVVDEVCARDFFAGTPMSGRTVISGDRHWSAPYFEPFGKSAKWASIPADKSESFARFCLNVSLDLWHEVGRFSGEKVLTAQIPRSLNLLSESGYIVDDLRKHCDMMAELKSITKEIT